MKSSFAARYPPRCDTSESVISLTTLPATLLYLVCMQRSKIISAILAVLVFASSVQAQTNDWRKVEFLEPGRRIIVKAQHNIYCSFEGATDDQLICEVREARSIHTTTISIPRADVREVRTLPNQAKSAWIGAGIGAGTGAIAGGVQSRDYPGVHAFFGGLAGAGIGALVGSAVPIFKLAITRGEVIYRR
jgi:hypothetical protein